MPTARKKPASELAGRRGSIDGAMSTPATGGTSATPGPSTSRSRRHLGKAYTLTPAERVERLAMTGWCPAWVAARWGVSEAVLAGWIAGTGKPAPGFLRWLWRMSNVITGSLPRNHPPRLKPPPVRWREMAEST